MKWLLGTEGGVTCFAEYTEWKTTDRVAGKRPFGQLQNNFELLKAGSVESAETRQPNA